MLARLRRSLGGRGKRAVLATLACIALLLGLSGVVLFHRTAGTAYATGVPTDIILLHGIAGFNGQNGLNCDDTWGGVIGYLENHGWSAANIVVLNFYVNDTACSSNVVTNTLYQYDPTETCRNVGAGNPANDEGTTNEPIERLGCKLDWYIYNYYTSIGRPVMVFAHSMGGVITRWGLGFDQHDSDYPGPLWVPAVVTVGTPHKATDGGGLLCGACYEAGEIANTQANFMGQLAPITSPNGDLHGTSWLTMAMSTDVPQDCVSGPKPGEQTCTRHCRPANVDFSTTVWPDPIGSTMSGSYRVEYTDPCYSHGAYLSNRPYPYSYNPTSYDTPPNDDTSDASAYYCDGCQIGATLSFANATFAKPLKMAVTFLQSHLPTPPTPTATNVPTCTTTTETDNLEEAAHIDLRDNFWHVYYDIKRDSVNNAPCQMRVVVRIYNPAPDGVWNGAVGVWAFKNGTYIDASWSKHSGSGTYANHLVWRGPWFSATSATYIIKSVEYNGSNYYTRAQGTFTI